MSAIDFIKDYRQILVSVVAGAVLALSGVAFKVWRDVEVLKDRPVFESANFVEKEDIPTLVRNLLPDLDNVVREDDLPDFGKFALSNDIPDLQEYARITDLPSNDGYALTTDLPKMEDYALKTELPKLEGYALKTELPKLEEYALKTELPAPVNLSNYALKADLAQYSKKGSVSCRVVSHSRIAQCAASEYLTGGGAHCDGGDALVSGILINPAAKTVTYSNFNNPSSTFCWNGGWGRKVQVQAVCCKTN